MSDKEINNTEFVVPTLSFDFPPWPRPESVPLESKDQLSFIAKYKLNPGDVFCLSDNDVIIKATLQKTNGRFGAIIHWATIREVIA